MRRRTRPRHASAEEPQINLTPLIDVVFVVLITFLVIAPLLNIDSVRLAPGNTGASGVKTVQGKSPIAIHVKEDNTIWVLGREIHPNNLPSYLASAHAAQPTAKPQLFHDRRAQFGTYQTVKNAMELAGFDEMEVVLEPR